MYVEIQIIRDTFLCHGVQMHINEGWREREGERERFSATSMKKIEGMPKLLEGKKEEIEDEKKLG